MYDVNELNIIKNNERFIKRKSYFTVNIIKRTNNMCII